MRTKTKAWLNVVFLFMTLIVNGMGGMGLINDTSQQEVSDTYPTLITPAPSTFSIWSVIYTLLVISIIVMTFKYKDSYYKRAVDRISYLFWASCVLNIIWIVSFSYFLIGVSTIFIFAFLIVMVLIANSIGKIQTSRRWLLPAMFGLYSGWLFIATVVNIAVWLVSVEWDRFGIADEIWGLLILIIAVGLTWMVLSNIKNAIFPIPVAWGYYGIYTNLFSPEGYQGDFTILQYTALTGVVLLVGVSAVRFYKNAYAIMPHDSVKTG